MFRLFPLLIIMLVTVATLKLLLAIEDTSTLFDAKISSTVFAQDHGAEKKEEEAGADKKKEESDSALKISEERPETVQSRVADYTESELDLLKNLAKRRDELEDKEKAIKDKANLLKATEARVDEKIADLKALQKEVEVALSQFNSKKDEELKSLVKVYENMKPKDAAKIFEELDMSIMLEVASKMKEAKLAPVLAQMNPQKAKDLTTRLAEQLKIAGSKKQQS